MDINMRNVELFKDGNWIKIKTGEIKENNKTINVGIKLLYDDGKTAEEIYKKTFTDFSVKGRYEILEDCMGTFDFVTSAVEAFCTNQME